MNTEGFQSFLIFLKVELCLGESIRYKKKDLIPVRQFPLNLHLYLFKFLYFFFFEELLLAFFCSFFEGGGAALDKKEL